MVRTFAIIQQFGCSSHKNFQKEPFSIKQLQAELFLMRISQEKNFSKEISKLSKGEEIDFKNSNLREYNPT
jgi:NAD(P)H-flavin reductase